MRVCVLRVEGGMQTMVGLVRDGGGGGGGAMQCAWVPPGMGHQEVG